MQGTIRMPVTFTAAKTEIETRLSRKRLCMSSYKNRQSVLNCTCTNFVISDVGKGADADNDASFTLTLNYTVVDIHDGKFQSANKCMVLNILSSVGDFAWGCNNIQRVWRNDYPSTVAIEDTSGEVYFVFLRAWGIELMYFATLSTPELQALDTLHFSNPFKIQLNANVMFDYIEGDIGLIQLRDGVEIVFNTAVPIVLTTNSYDRNVIKSSKDVELENKTK